MKASTQSSTQSVVGSRKPDCHQGARFSHRLNQKNPASCPNSKRSACRFQRFVRPKIQIDYILKLEYN